VVVVALVIVAFIGFFLVGRQYLASRSKNASPKPTELPSATASAIPTATANVSATATPRPTKSPTPTPSRSPSPSPAPLTMTLNSNGLLDGFESSNGGGNIAVELRAGRNSTLIERGFVSFDIPASLSGKTIDKATLRLYQGQIVGSPYTSGISVKVDHVDYGNSLENADYSVSSLSSNFGTLTSNSVIEWKDLDVTDLFKDDQTNLRPRSQYRLHMATETTGGDVTGDFAYFESQDNNMGTGNYPQLVIKYH